MRKSLVSRLFSTNTMLHSPPAPCPLPFSLVRYLVRHADDVVQPIPLFSVDSNKKTLLAKQGAVSVGANPAGIRVQTQTTRVHHLAVKLV
jgi:hypothetical protein